MQRLWNALKRRQNSDDDGSNSLLARVLTLFDLTMLGVGGSLGLGVYVLAGSVAHDKAGPAVTLSFLIAAVAAMISGICYAEFASRVPKAGSAYVYSYVTVGEFVAFTIGWNLVLEYVIGSASIARGLSGYIDSLFGNRIMATMLEMFPMHVPYLATYPDFLACFFVMILTASIACGVKGSTMVNNALTTINLLTILGLIVAGCFKANPANWFIPKSQIPPHVNGGNGGFMPFGISGVTAGAAKVFYGFLGFDCVAATGEEALNPKRNVPLAIVLSLVLILCAFFGVSTVLTMMLPYYLQDPLAPIPHVFEVVGWGHARWVITVGAIISLYTSLLGTLFPLPRVLYAMASDGLLFGALKQINKRTQTPLLATIVAGVMTGVMTLLIGLQQLMDMMAIGTLLAYTMVASCVLVLHYETDDATRELGLPVGTGARQFVRQLANVDGLAEPTRLSSVIVKVAIVLYAALTTVLCSMLTMLMYDGIRAWCLVVAGGAAAVMMTCVLVILRQPKSELLTSFRVPLVPWVPCLSVFLNLYLMWQLDMATWVRFTLWGVIGLCIYFFYGIHHSNVKRSLDVKLEQEARLENYAKVIEDKLGAKSKETSADKMKEG